MLGQQLGSNVPCSGQERIQLDVLATTKRVLGGEHPNTLSLANNLAATYQSQGKYAEAERIQLDVLATTKRVPNTLSLANNLAETYMLQGKYAEAKMIRELSPANTQQTLAELEHSQQSSSSDHQRKKRRVDDSQ